MTTWTDDFHVDDLSNYSVIGFPTPVVTGGQLQISVATSGGGGSLDLNPNSGFQPTLDPAAASVKVVEFVIDPTAMSAPSVHLDTLDDGGESAVYTRACAGSGNHNYIGDTPGAGDVVDSIVPPFWLVLRVLSASEYQQELWTVDPWSGVGSAAHIRGPLTRAFPAATRCGVGSSINDVGHIYLDDFVWSDVAPPPPPPPPPGASGDMSIGPHNVGIIRRGGVRS